MTQHANTTSLYPHTLSSRHLLYAMLLLLSTAVYAITFNIFIVGIWLALWFISKEYATNTKGMDFLIFYLGFYLLYPNYSSAYHPIHHNQIALSFVLLVFIILYRPAISALFNKFTSAKLVFYGWIFWVALVYSQLLYANYIHYMIYGVPFAENPLNIITLTRDSHMLSIVLPMFTAPLVMLIPMFALRNGRDFDSLRNALIKLTILLTIISIIRYVFNIEFIPHWDKEIRFNGFRMGSFAAANPNSFGRLLLLPLLFLASLAIYSPSKLRPYGWIALLLIVFCMIFTFSRTSYLSSIAGIAVLALLNIRRIKKSIKLVVMILLFTTIIFTQFNLNAYFEAEHGRSSGHNFIARLVMYEAAYQIISENPLYGAYPGGHPMSKLKLDIPGLQSGSAHNIFLNVCVEWGLPMGTLLMLALFLALWNGTRITRKHIDKLNFDQIGWVKGISNFAIAISVAYTVHGATENIAPYFVFFILGLSIAARRTLLFNNSFA